MIHETSPTSTIGAITAFNALMNTPGACADDFPCFDRIFSVGALIPPALVEMFRARPGISIYSSYGMTETVAPTHLAPVGRPTPVDAVSGALFIGIARAQDGHPLQSALSTRLKRRNAQSGYPKAEARNSARSRGARDDTRFPICGMLWPNRSGSHATASAK